MRSRKDSSWAAVEEASSRSNNGGDSRALEGRRSTGGNLCRNSSNKDHHISSNRMDSLNSSKVGLRSRRDTGNMSNSSRSPGNKHSKGSNRSRGLGHSGRVISTIVD